jgi:hypothetical protein
LPRNGSAVGEAAGEVVDEGGLAGLELGGEQHVGAGRQDLVDGVGDGLVGDRELFDEGEPRGWDAELGGGVFEVEGALGFAADALHVRLRPRARAPART